MDLNDLEKHYIMSDLEDENPPAANQGQQKKIKTLSKAEKGKAGLLADKFPGSEQSQESDALNAGAQNENKLEVPLETLKQLDKDSADMSLVSQTGCSPQRSQRKRKTIINYALLDKNGHSQNPGQKEKQTSPKSQDEQAIADIEEGSNAGSQKAKRNDLLKKRSFQ